MRPLIVAAIAIIITLCSGCDDPWPAPPGTGRYAVWTLDAYGDVRGFLCDSYSVGHGGALTATVREVLATGGYEGKGPRVGALVTWHHWVTYDLETGQLRHH